MEQIVEAEWRRRYKVSECKSSIADFTIHESSINLRVNDKVELSKRSHTVYTISHCKHFFTFHFTDLFFRCVTEQIIFLFTFKHIE